MKHLFLSVRLVLALTGTLAFAQSAPTPDNTAPQKTYSRHHHAPDPNRMAQRIGQRLGLTEDQTAKLEPIFADSQQKMAALRSDTSLSPDQRRQQFRSIHENVKTQLSGVLTPEQMQQLRSMHHGRFQHQHPQGTTTPPAGN